MIDLRSQGGQVEDKRIRARAWMWEHPIATALFALVAFLFVLAPLFRGNGKAFLGGVILLAIVVWFTSAVMRQRSEPRSTTSDWSIESTENEENETMSQPRMTENDRRRAAAIAAGTYVKTYRTREEFQRHAAELATDNWAVASVVERKPNAGCLRILLLWWLVLIFPPKPELLVTYRYEDPNKARPEVDVQLHASIPDPDVVTQQACFNCGAIVSITHKFCPNCGAPLGQRTVHHPEAIPAESDVVDVEFDQKDQ